MINGSQISLLADFESVAKAIGLDAKTIRQVERGSIHDFVSVCDSYLNGRVLDFGAGKPGTCRVPQPYKSLVPGDYNPYDLGDPYPIGPYDSILCTQVLQYVEDPKEQLKEFASLLSTNGYLILTYPTNWDEVEESDLWRFTKSGMEFLVENAGFEIINHERRAEVDLNGFKFPLGYGLVAKKLKPRYVPNQEDSAFFLTRALERKHPFLFLRFGDGMIECMEHANDKGHYVGRERTCDYEDYTIELGRDLKRAWDTALANPTGLYIGDWLSASFSPRDKKTQYTRQYKKLLGKTTANSLHYEALLFHSNRPGVTELQRFWAAIKNDTRAKVLMGPPAMARAAKILGARHFSVPLGGLHKQLPQIRAELMSLDFDILLWGAGMASSIPVIECREQFPNRTYINIGSALDPIFRYRTRTQQMNRFEASNTFFGAIAELLGEGKRK